MEWVSDLINSNTRSWDIAKVNSTFLPFEAQVILGIPISPRLPIDALTWAWTPNGHFTVKSVYKVAQQSMQKTKGRVDKGECSDGISLRALWKLIWNLNCPNKVKHFMWRACKNILPIKCKLRVRGIGVEVSCDLCGGEENSGHIL